MTDKTKEIDLAPSLDQWFQMIIENNHVTYYGSTDKPRAIEIVSKLSSPVEDIRHFFSEIEQSPKPQVP